MRVNEVTQTQFRVVAAVSAARGIFYQETRNPGKAADSSGGTHNTPQKRLLAESVLILSNERRQYSNSEFSLWFTYFGTSWSA